MTEGGQIGIFVLLAGIFALIFRLVRPSKPTPLIKPPPNKAAADARAIIEADGEADIREIVDDLDSDDRLSLLSERADRRRRDR